MNGLPGRFSARGWTAVGLVVLLALLLTTPLQAKTAKNLPFRAYLTGEAGWGTLSSTIYDNLIDNSYYRYGGGFGVEYGKYNAEVLYRTGTESWRSGMALVGYQGPVVSDGQPFRTQDIQFKIGYAPLARRLRTPIGIMATYTTFSSSTVLNVPYAQETSGWTIGTYMGSEFAMTRWLAFGVEVQYNVGVQTGRPGPMDFYYNQSQNPGSISNVPFSTVPPGMSYFENAGLFDTSNNSGFSRGGYLIQVRTIIYLPEI